MEYMDEMVNYFVESKVEDFIPPPPPPPPVVVQEPVEEPVAEQIPLLEKPETPPIEEIPKSEPKPKVSKTYIPSPTTITGFLPTLSLILP